MKMPSYVSEHIQERIASLLLDCDYAHSFYQCLPAEINSRERWQLSVDILYRLLLCELVIPGHYRKSKNTSGADSPPSQLADDCESYLNSLAKTNPESGDIQDYVVWQEWDLCLGRNGERLLKKHGIDDSISPLNLDFITDIEILFARMNVAWTEDPLLPIEY